MAKTTKNLNMCMCVRVLGAQCHVRPHKEDPKTLVLKTGNMEAVHELCSVLGVTPVKTWQGSNYYITQVPKEEFSEAVKKLAAGEISMEIDVIEEDADATEYGEEGPVVGKC